MPCPAILNSGFAAHYVVGKVAYRELEEQELFESRAEGSQMNKKECRMESGRRAGQLTEEQIESMSARCLILRASLPEYRASKMLFSFVGVGKEPRTLPLF
jgi:hypothetical protein